LLSKSKIIIFRKVGKHLFFNEIISILLL